MFRRTCRGDLFWPAACRSFCQVKQAYTALTANTRTNSARYVNSTKNYSKILFNAMKIFLNAPNCAKTLDSDREMRYIWCSITNQNGNLKEKERMYGELYQPVVRRWGHRTDSERHRLGHPGHGHNSWHRYLPQHPLRLPAVHALRTYHEEHDGQGPSKDGGQGRLRLPLQGHVYGAGRIHWHRQHCRRLGRHRHRRPRRRVLDVDFRTARHVYQVRGGHPVHPLPPAQRKGRLGRRSYVLH